MAAWSSLASANGHCCSLALGLAGASAIIVTGTLLARMQWLNFLRYCGEHSIVIYLAFFLPMAVTRTLLLRTALIPDIGMVSLIVTVVGVAGALAIWRLALALHANFLFGTPQCVLDRAEEGRSGLAGGGIGPSSSPAFVRRDPYAAAVVVEEVVVEEGV